MRTPLKTFGFIIAAMLLLSSTSCDSGFPTASMITGLAFPKLQTMKQAKSWQDLSPSAPENPDTTKEPAKPSRLETIAASLLTKPSQPTFSYTTRPGDTLAALASRFEVSPDKINASQPLDPRKMLPAGITLQIPNTLSAQTTSDQLIIPDSEMIFSLSAEDFDTQAFVQHANGLLSVYDAFIPYYKDAAGWEIVQYVARNYSVNPRLLLSLMERHSHWVLTAPETLVQELYPLGHRNGNYENLYPQLFYAAQQLSIGYYGWRDGTLTTLTFRDGSQLRLHPALNAGTVAVMHFYAQVYDRPAWEAAMDPQTGFIALHNAMFGDPWERAASYAPIFPEAGITQPEIQLPFEGNDLWFYSSGPHGAWVDQGPQAAIDFTPSTDKLRCVTADNWVVAPASGLITRLSSGLLVLDLDMDGSEQTGWVIMLLHLEADESLRLGDQILQDQRIGHASCLGGRATDSHIHLARKYNGEWIHAGGPIPFVIGSWEVISGNSTYEGFMTDGNTTLRASITGTEDTQIRREVLISNNP